MSFCYEEEIKIYYSEQINLVLPSNTPRIYMEH